MPKLKSGRMVGVGQIDLAELARVGPDYRVWAFCVAFRLLARRPENLLTLLPVVLFDPETGPPPEGLPRPTGDTVGEVLSGKAPGWTDEEIAEFRNWLHSDPTVNAWIHRHHHEVHCAIRDSMIWDSEWVTDEPEPGARH